MASAEGHRGDAASASDAKDTGHADRAKSSDTDAGSSSESSSAASTKGSRSRSRSRSASSSSRSSTSASSRSSSGRSHDKRRHRRRSHGRTSSSPPARRRDRASSSHKQRSHSSHGKHSRREQSKRDHKHKSRNKHRSRGKHKREHKHKHKHEHKHKHKHKHKRRHGSRGSSSKRRKRDYAERDGSAGGASGSAVTPGLSMRIEDPVPYLGKARRDGRGGGGSSSAGGSGAGAGAGAGGDATFLDTLQAQGVAAAKLLRDKQYQSARSLQRKSGQTLQAKLFGASGGGDRMARRKADRMHRGLKTAAALGRRAADAAKRETAKMDAMLASVGLDRGTLASKGVDMKPRS